jgi:hypothetical protein
MGTSAASVGLYRKYGADRIVAESNQGGAMVETTIRTVDQNASYKAVHASRGKVTRAEPVAALAEQFRVHLVGTFPQLEDQLCSYQAGSSGSPDRLDAMVWAFTELMVETSGNTGMLDHYRQMYEAQFGKRDAPDAPASPIDGEIADEIVALRAPPPGCGEVQGLSGQNYRPDSRGLFLVTRDDAKPLLRGGFTMESIDHG